MSRAAIVVGDDLLAAARVAEGRRHRTVVAGWPEVGSRRLEGVLCHGIVRDEADAALALLAAVGGADIVALVPAWTPATDRFLDDLRRVADVEVVTAGAAPNRGSASALSADDLLILDAYGRGLRRVEVARTTSQSPRSLDRRVAEIKRRLGARSIAHAIELVRRADSG